jgi:hypothetical protein
MDKAMTKWTKQSIPGQSKAQLCPSFVHTKNVNFEAPELFSSSSSSFLIRNNKKRTKQCKNPRK